MQLEESGSSKDVPPLSCRGKLELSTFVENRVAQLNTIGFSCCKVLGSFYLFPIHSGGSQQVPD
jgi:hypothetical protein